MSSTRVCGFPLVFTLLSTCISLAWADNSNDKKPAANSTAANSNATTPSDLVAKRRDIAERINKLSAVTRTTSTTVGEPTALVAAAELKLLRNLDLVYLHHQTALEQNSSATADADLIREELLALRSTTIAPDTRFSWVQFEDLRDQLDAESVRAESHATELSAAHSALTIARDKAKTAERQRRQVYDEPLSKNDTSKASAQEYRRRSAGLEAELADATVALRQAEWQLRKRLQENCVTRRTLFAERIQQMKPLVVYAEEDWRRRDTVLAAYEAELQGRLVDAQARLRKIDILEAAAKKLTSPIGGGVQPVVHLEPIPANDEGKYDEDKNEASNAPSADAPPAEAAAAIATPAPTAANPTAKPFILPKSVSDVTRRELRRLCNEEVQELERRLAELPYFRDIGLQRFRFTNGKLPDDELRGWIVAVRQLVTQLHEEDHRLSVLLEGISQDLVTVNRERRLAMADVANRGDSAAAGPTLANPKSTEEVDLRMQALERLREAVEFGQRQVRTFLRVGTRFRDDLDPPTAKVENVAWTDRISKSAVTIWHYELIAVGEKPITVGKVITGVLGVLAGIGVAATISRFIGRRVLPRLGMNPGGCEALRSLSFYVLCVIFAVLSMEVAQVPLTAFTFLGGAAAIGVGFGSQNIVNNFISGLILLAEQPVRVGDLVEWNGTNGRIERIGARSTVVRTGDNIELVVPNSKLLENNVTNLTLGDSCVRTRVRIGVAYGSSVPDVKQQLRTAAAQHPDVLSAPAPNVLFTDFADSSLNFELLFWVRLEGAVNCRQVESDVRESIDTLFRDAGIVMAFPQRDIHLDTLQPLEIRLARRESSELGIRRAA